MKKSVLLGFLAAGMSVMAFTGCANENTVSGSTIDVVEETMTEETEAVELYMTLDANGIAGGTLSVTMEDGTVEESGAWGFTLAEGKTVGEILAAEGMTGVDVIMSSDENIDGEEGDEYTETESDDVFEGWIEYKMNGTADADGFFTYTYERMSGETYYTTEELLAMPAPDYEVLYVAKWESVPEEEYYKTYEMADDGLDLYLTMYANGGYLWKDGEDAYDFELGVYAIETDQTFGFMINDEEDVSIHNDYAWFAGWTVYTGESIEWVDEEPVETEETDVVLNLGDHGYGIVHNFEIVGEGLSDEELMEIVCEGTEYVAMAMWE